MPTYKSILEPSIRFEFTCLCLFVYFFRHLGAFSRFLPTLPYPFVSGDNSPPINTHSPPAAAAAMTNLPVAPTVLRPQPQLPPNAAAAVAAAAAAAAAVAGRLNNISGVTTTAATTNLSPLRIRVSSPNRINSDLTSIVHQQHGLANRTNGITHIPGSGGVGIGNGPSAIGIGPPMLHRPFSPSPQPKDVS